MMRRDFENDEAERAFRRGYEKGCKEGWRKAMEEAERYYGNRGGMMPNSYSERGDYAQRNITGNDYSYDPGRLPGSEPYFMREHEHERMMQERRGVPGTGPYSRMHR